jgi:uncharacterized protein YggT (Ycf19 family)
LARLSQFIDYIFWLLYSLLIIRLILVFFSANSWTGFVRFVDTLTNPFYAPFRGIVASQTVGGASPSRYRCWSRSSFTGCCTWRSTSCSG